MLSAIPRRVTNLPGRSNHIPASPGGSWRPMRLAGHCALVAQGRLLTQEDRMLGWLIEQLWPKGPPMCLMIAIVLICGAFGIVIATAMAIGGFGWFFWWFHGY